MRLVGGLAVTDMAEMMITSRGEQMMACPGWMCSWFSWIGASGIRARMNVDDVIGHVPNEVRFAFFLEWTQHPYYLWSINYVISTLLYHIKRSMVTLSSSHEKTPPALDSFLLVRQELLLWRRFYAKCRVDSALHTFPSSSGVVSPVNYKK
jgi:hypothetical protein